MQFIIIINNILNYYTFVLMETNKRKPGRPTKDKDAKKLPYSVSLTPTEYKLLTHRYGTLTQAILSLIS